MGSTLLFYPVLRGPEPYSSLPMKQESNKEMYLTPETEEFFLSLDAPIAQNSQTEPIIDDPDQPM